MAGSTEGDDEKNCTAANLTFEQLPYIETFISHATRCNKLCYNHLMGMCTNKRCWCKHPERIQIPDAFASNLCNVCGPGIDYGVRNEPSQA